MEGQGQEQYQPINTTAPSNTPTGMPMQPQQKKSGATALVLLVVIIVLLLGAWMIMRNTNQGQEMTQTTETSNEATTPSQDVDSIVSDIYTSTSADSQTTVNSSPTDFSGLYQN